MTYSHWFMPGLCVVLKAGSNSDEKLSMARTRFSIGAAIFVGLVFGGPFAGFGTFALCEGYRKLESGSYKMGELIGLFGAGGLFCLIGYGTIIALFRSHQYDKKIQKLEERYPHEPWRHRLDWAAGQIFCSS
ncbi:MAG: hypothetical protein KDD62_12140, partial [Bdellovibrionales bacterium]|nr:hypothetical protein [Bdellovibrionales bacterium]